MYPLNDNDLDRLSRDAAEQYDVDQNTSTSGWEALESRLNKELPLKDEKERRRFLFWLFFIALLAGGSLWYMLAGNGTGAGSIAQVATVPSATTNSDAKNTNPSAEQVSPNAGITSGDAVPAGEQPAANAQGNTTTESKPVTPGNESPVTAGDRSTGSRNQPSAATSGKKNEPVIVDEWVIGDEAIADVPKRTVKNVKKGTRVKAKNGTLLPVASAEKAPKKEKDDQGVAITNTNDPTKDKEKDTPPVTTTETTKDNTVTNDQAVTPPANNKTDTAALANAMPVTPPVAAKDSAADQKATAAIPKKKDDKKDNKKVKGFEIGIVGGPDMSNVKFTHTADAGFNVGLQVGYRFSNRWSVSTGAIYTKKNYEVNGDDVTKYGWFANPNVKVKAMEGYCNMWDIPVNVRYDFSVNQKRRFYASTGLSTYIMKKENYDYYYTYGSSTQDYTRNWDSKANGVGDSTYLFSILNLSAGFERTLGKKLSIQAEPYFKLPLSQLGHGKLNLNSYGIYFSLKYKLSK